LGKYVIGLTGNIATGKSEVLRMLERLGAKVIDADALAHRLMIRGTSLWQAVVREFGEGILSPEGEIDRRKLADIVFSNPQALRRLEALVHPAVIAQVEAIIQEAREPVVAVEAIKLIEAGMHRRCQSLWVVTCPLEQQVARLMKSRGMSREEALRRIRAQPPPEEKIALADIVIDNSRSLEETWVQVREAWERLGLSRRWGRRIPVTVRRARREDVPLIAAFLRHARCGKKPGEAQVREKLFEQGYWLAEREGTLMGLTSWLAENLVACIEEPCVYPARRRPPVVRALLKAIEEEARFLQCEAAILFVKEGVSRGAFRLYEKCGYQRRELEELGRIWREVAREYLPQGHFLMVKKLREKPVTRPL